MLKLTFRITNNRHSILIYW